jgi:hypothetical protein
LAPLEFRMMEGSISLPAFQWLRRRSTRAQTSGDDQERDATPFGVRD